MAETLDEGARAAARFCNWRSSELAARRYFKTSANVDRAAQAERAVIAFDPDEDDVAITDLLCGLRHLCAQNPEVYGSFARALRLSREHFPAEAVPDDIEVSCLEPEDRQLCGLTEDGDAPAPVQA